MSNDVPKEIMLSDLVLEDLIADFEPVSGDHRYVLASEVEAMQKEPAELLRRLVTEVSHHTRGEGGFCWTECAWCGADTGGKHFQGCEYTMQWHDNPAAPCDCGFRDALIVSEKVAADRHHKAKEGEPKP
jgi:hypothetical protein